MHETRQRAKVGGILTVLPCLLTELLSQIDDTQASSFRRLIDATKIVDGPRAFFRSEIGMETLTSWFYRAWRHSLFIVIHSALPTLEFIAGCLHCQQAHSVHVSFHEVKPMYI